MKKFEQMTINFKIISNKNKNVYTEGYVNINDEEAEDVDWYFWDGSQYSSQRTIHHDEIKISGSTVKQENEIAEFESDLADDEEWIDDCILQSEEEENSTYQRENLTVIINEGAKMECKITELPEEDYWVTLTFTYNGEGLNLDDDLIKELAEEIDFTYASEGRYIISDNTSIKCEISKNHYGIFTDDKFYIKETESIIKEHINDAKKIFAKQLVRNLGVYSIAGCLYEEKHGKLNRSGMDSFANKWEQYFEDCSIEELLTFTNECIKKFLKKELKKY